MGLIAAEKNPLLFSSLRLPVAFEKVYGVDAVFWGE
jgi:hypothetical protein